VRFAAICLTMLAIAGPAQAATVTLDIDGAYREVAPHVYFVPGGGAVGLRGTLLDDAGVAGASCMIALREPFGAPAFASDGVWCPAPGGWSGGVRVTENVRLKTAVVPDPRNSATESPVLTLLTAPRLTWSGAGGAVRFRVAGGLTGYTGSLTVRRRGHVVARARVAGGAARSVRVAGVRRFTATLTPADPQRWAAVAATARPLGGSGEARPVTAAIPRTARAARWAAL
jgi:hypothetical protein